MGDPVSGGDILGFVEENGLMKKHYNVCPPNVSGRIVKLYGRDTDGNEMFTVRDTVAEVEDDVRGVTPTKIISFLACSEAQTCRRKASRMSATDHWPTGH